MKYTRNYVEYKWYLFNNYIYLRFLISTYKSSLLFLLVRMIIIPIWFDLYKFFNRKAWFLFNIFFSSLFSHADKSPFFELLIKSFLYFASLITGDKYIANKIKKTPKVKTLLCLFHHDNNLFSISNKFLYDFNHFTLKCN